MNVIDYIKYAFELNSNILSTSNLLLSAEWRGGSVLGPYPRGRWIDTTLCYVQTFRPNFLKQNRVIKLQWIKIQWGLSGSRTRDLAHPKRESYHQTNRPLLFPTEQRKHTQIIMADIYFSGEIVHFMSLFTPSVERAPENYQKRSNERYSSHSLSFSLEREHRTRWPSG